MRNQAVGKLAAVVLVPILAAVAAVVVLLNPRAEPYAFAMTPECEVDGGSQQDVQRFLADNGLYAVPELFGRKHPSLYDSAYGLAAMRATGGAVRLSATPAETRELMAEDPSGSAVWPRLYLFMIQQASGTALLDAGDADALMGLIGPGGYLEEATSDDVETSTAQRLSDTGAGLEVLRVVRGADFTAGLTTTRQWLTSLAATYDPHHPYLDLVLARAMQDVGLTVPDKLLKRNATWAEDQMGRSAAADTGEAVHDFFGYASLKKLSGQAVPQSAFTYYAPLVPAALKSGDLQLTYLVAGAWGQEDTFTAGSVAAQVTGKRLPSGLITENAKIVGSLDATYVLESTQATSGLNTCDPALARALSTFAETAWTSLDATGKGMWVAAYKMANGSVGDERRRDALQALLADLPASVSLDDAGRWSLEASLIDLLGGKAPEPRVTSWGTGTREELQAYAALVNGFAGAGIAPSGISGIEAVDFARALGDSASTPTTYEYFDDLLAFMHLGGKVTPTMQEAAAARLVQVRRCASSTLLVAAAPGSDECNLKSSLSLASARQAIPELTAP